MRLKRQPVIIYKRRKKQQSTADRNCDCESRDQESKEDVLGWWQGEGAGLLKNGVHPLHRMFRRDHDDSAAEAPARSRATGVRCEECSNAE